MSSDLISRKALIEFARNHKDCMVDANDIARFPAVDAVEVVRCRDCEYYNVFRLECHNRRMNGVIGIDGYCSYGERRSE